ncbi:MAG: VWA domain-containing protein [Hyphomicrobiaceae bacterium]
MSMKERTPADRPGGAIPEEPAGTGDSVAEFLAKVRSLPPRQSEPGARGRLIFAMDATMSRQPTWDMALRLQAGMFEAVKSVGGLHVQLVYFRGYDECRASKWTSDADRLAELMGGVGCRGGHTQIRKVLRHAIDEVARQKVDALVYVGDAMEEEIDDLSASAGQLALSGLRLFLFQEGGNRRAARAFAELARLTQGSHCRFDEGAADMLAMLLKAVAVYAAGGERALLEATGADVQPGARLLLEQLRATRP